MVELHTDDRLAEGQRKSHSSSAGNFVIRELLTGKKKESEQ